MLVLYVNMLISLSNASNLFPNGQFVAYFSGHFVNIAMVKVELISDVYTMVIVLIN